MGYKHKYAIGSTYAFYNNSDAIETSLNFNYLVLDLVHADTFIQVVEDIAILSKDTLTGGFRFYVEDFVFPLVDIGCYRFAVIDTASSDNVLYLSDPFEVVNSSDDLIYCIYRNEKNILNYNYETLSTFYNKTHIELFKRKPLRPTTTKGYVLSNGSFNRVRTILTKTWEFITGWFDTNEHDALQAIIIHSDLQIIVDGNFVALNLPEGSEYTLDWQENYEFIQASVRLQINDESSSNKAI